MVLIYINKSTHNDRFKKHHQKKNNKDHVLMLVVLLVSTFLTSFRNASLSLSEYTYAGHSKGSPG